LLSLIQGVGTPPQDNTPLTEIKQYYGFNSINFGTTPGDGSGQTIAVVAPWNDPNIGADLQQFDIAMGLSDAPSFSVVPQPFTAPANAQQGDPSGNVGIEISGDVEWAHAIAPGAKIILVVAQSDSAYDLFTSARYAASLPNVSVVSMSWGETEGNFINELLGQPIGNYEKGFDQDFTTPSGHIGVTFVASSGDYELPLYPALSPNVLAVGGTTLLQNISASSGGNTVTYQETRWDNSGGGQSLYEPEPSYQTGVQSSGMRQIPDVAMEALPGVSVYDSYDTTGGHWLPSSQPFAGTSLAAPMWAGLIAIANQGLTSRGSPTLENQEAMDGLYSAYAEAPSVFFNDLGTPGYNEVTGLGSPIAPAVVAALTGIIATPTPTGPNGTIITTMPTFQWPAVTGAVDYHLTVEDLGTGVKTVLDAGRSTSYTPTSPLCLPGHSYLWSVTAVGYQGESKPSDSITIAVPAPAAPQLIPIGDSGVAQSTTPTLYWVPMSGPGEPAAAEYSVTIFDMSNPGVLVASASGITGTSYT
jgi:subtilase family serine protease